MAKLDFGELEKILGIAGNLDSEFKRAHKLETDPNDPEQRITPGAYDRDLRVYWGKQLYGKVAPEHFVGKSLDRYFGELDEKAKPIVDKAKSLASSHISENYKSLADTLDTDELLSHAFKFDSKFTKSEELLKNGDVKAMYEELAGANIFGLVELNTLLRNEPQNIQMIYRNYLNVTKDLKLKELGSKMNEEGTQIKHNKSKVIDYLNNVISKLNEKGKNVAYMSVAYNALAKHKQSEANKD